MKLYLSLTLFTSALAQTQSTTAESKCIHPSSRETDGLACRSIPTKPPSTGPDEYRTLYHNDDCINIQCQVCGECLLRPQLGYQYCVWDYAIWNDTDGSGCYVWDGHVDSGQTKVSGSSACLMIKTLCGANPSAPPATSPANTVSGVTTATTGIPTPELDDSASPAVLGPSDRVALGVGIGLGLPTAIVCLLAWWCYPRMRRNREPSPSPPHSTMHTLSAALPVAPMSELPSSSGHGSNYQHAAASELPVPSSGPSATFIQRAA